MKINTETLELLYGKDDALSQKTRYENMLSKFTEYFGNGDDVRIFSAPGRTEVGGNHTDHNRGNVLAAAIGLDAVAFVRKTNDNIVTIKSEGFQISPVDLSDLNVNEEEFGTSEGLIRGMAAGISEICGKICGFDAYVSSNVLSGSGLSSSAAFEVLVGNVFRGLLDLDVSDVKIAQIAQYSENKYFGKPCGLMDQMASSVGGFITIDFTNLDNPAIKKVNFDFTKYGISLYIVDTKGSHADLTDDYAAIPLEMKSVARFFGKSDLRDVTKEELWDNINDVRKACGDRAVSRAFHYFDESMRAVKEFEALENDNISEFFRLVRESGESSYMYLQNIFSTKNPREQALVLGLYTAHEVLGNEGAYRVHGGGFAGTIQCFVPIAKEEEFVNKMTHLFGKGNVYKLYIRPVGGIEAGN